MKTNYLSRAFLFCAIIAATLFVGCEKDDVDTNDPGNGGTDTEEPEATDVPKMGDVAVVQGTMTKTSATLSHVLALTNGKITKSGLCWSTEENPDTTDMRKDQPVTLSAGTYTTQLVELAPGTVYYARSYAENSKGLSYSTQFSFKTDGKNEENATPPVLSVVTCNELGNKWAMLSAEITSDGNGTISGCGFCWSTTPNPTIESNKQDQLSPEGMVLITDRIRGLVEGTTYYVRAYAKNSKHISYSNDFEITTNNDQTLKAYAGPTSAPAVIIGVTPEAPYGTIPETDAIVAAEYNAIQVPCYPIAYGNSWLDKNTHNLDGFNSWVTWAQTNHVKVFGHFLVSHNVYYPDWFTKPETPWTNEELETMLEDRIKTVIQRATGKVDVWTVVNEAIALSPAGAYRQCVWSALGTEPAVTTTVFGPKIVKEIPLYVVKAFQYARRYAGAGVELTLCDAGFEVALPSADLKSQAFHQLVEHLKGKGLLDAVSLQTHITLGAAGLANPETQPRYDLINSRISLYKKMGLKVYLNEIDISVTLKAGQTLTEQQLTDQGLTYKKFVEVAINPPASYYCNVTGKNEPIDQTVKADGLLFWGLGDGHDPSFRPYDQAQLYDYNHQKKPAYFGVLNALKTADL